MPWQRVLGDGAVVYRDCEALILAAEEVIFGGDWGTYFIFRWVSSPIVAIIHLGPAVANDGRVPPRDREPVLWIKKLRVSPGDI